MVRIVLKCRKSRAVALQKKALKTLIREINKICIIQSIDEMFNSCKLHPEVCKFIGFFKDIRLQRHSIESREGKHNYSFVKTESSNL